MIENLIPINPYTRPGTIRSFTRNVVWHYTANPGASAYNHFIYFGKTLIEQNKVLEALAAKETDPVKKAEILAKRVFASAQYFIDPNETLLIIPEGELAYHASQANPYSIGVELCIEADGSFHPETIKQAVALGVELAGRYNLNPLTDYIRHYDVTGKICPKRWVDHPEEWEEFKQEVNRKLKGGDDLEKWVAATIVNTWLKPAWAEANTKGHETDKENIHLLANKLRLACGMKEDEEFEN